MKSNWLKSRFKTISLTTRTSRLIFRNKLLKYDGNIEGVWNPKLSIEPPETSLVPWSNSSSKWTRLTHHGETWPYLSKKWQDSLPIQFYCTGPPPRKSKFDGIKEFNFLGMEYSLERLKIEQIVVTERYSLDTLQWEKMRSFWHPDASQTSLKISWFNGTIDRYITENRNGPSINVGFKSQSKHIPKRFKHVITPVDVTSRVPPSSRSNWKSSWKQSSLRSVWWN